MSMKYINHKKMGMIIFEEHNTHKEIVGSLNISKEDIISAGFVSCNVVSGDISCYGDSVSLNIKSKISDSDRLFNKLTIY